jgi:outer membrane protein assembly factor BamE (lipoprotein component of BamABCDE complex)
MNQVKERVAFRRPKVVSRNVTAIAFNKESEQVESVNNYTLKDGKVIAYNGRETPTRGREMTVLEQMLGAVGRGGMLPREEEGVPGTRPGDHR